MFNKILKSMFTCFKKDKNIEQDKKEILFNKLDGILNKDIFSREENKLKETEVNKIFSVMEDLLTKYLDEVDNDSEQEKSKNIEIYIKDNMFKELNLEIQLDILKHINNNYIENGRVQSIKLALPFTKDLKNNIKAYKEFGVTELVLEINSSNEYILKKAKKDYTFNDVKTAVKVLKKYGITYSANMLIGMPESTLFDEINTAKDIAALKPKPEYVNVYIILVMKDSELEKELLEDNYVPLELELAVETLKKVTKVLNENKITVQNIGYLEENIKGFEAKIVAGPYEKNIKEIVNSNIWYDNILDEISKINVKIKNAKIFIHPKVAKIAFGPDNQALEKFEKRYGVKLVPEYDMTLKLHEFKIEVEEVFEEDKIGNKLNKNRKK